MDGDAGRKPSKLDEIKRKLYSRNYRTKIEHRELITRGKPEEIPSNWESSGKENKMEDFFGKTSLIKKFFIFSVGFFALAILYAGFTFLGGGNTVSNENIDISILGNTYAAGGEDLELEVNIKNKNNSSLDLADLVVEYPRGSGEALDMERYRVSLGTIPSGSLRKENVKLVLFGEQGSSRKIKFSLEYRVEGSNAIFIKEAYHEVFLSSTPVGISVDAPTEAAPNQNITFKVKV